VIAELQIEQWPIDRLIPYARNARTHTDEQVAQVAASIVAFGWTNPILVGADSVIIAGHARLAAARRLQMTTVPVIVLAHLTESQRRALVIADNRLSLDAGWDEEMLRLELDALGEDDFDLEVLGFSDAELAELLADPEMLALGHSGEDDSPALPTTSVSCRGDLWVLGEHRLLCGDAVVQEDLARLLAGGTADMVFTDPPYNVDYEGYTEERLTIKGDRMSDVDFRHFLQATFRSYQAAVKPGASMYVCHPSSWQREFQDALEAAGFFSCHNVDCDLSPYQASFCPVTWQ
jgi:ParB-like chromosome segregation protein Spo0J